MGLFKVLKKVAIGAAIGVATYGIGTAIAGGFTAAGAAGSATVSGGLKAAAKGGIKALASSGGSKGGGATPAPPDIAFNQSGSVKDILGKGGPTQVAQVGGKTLFHSKERKNTDILENPWQHTDDWWNDLGGEGKPSDFLNRYV